MPTGVATSLDASRRSGTRCGSAQPAVDWFLNRRRWRGCSDRLIRPRRTTLALALTVAVAVPLAITIAFSLAVSRAARTIPIPVAAIA